QTANPNLFEIIFVDDGSDDNSANIWESAKFESKFQLIQHKNNRGRSASRNSGIAQAKGEYCLFTNANIVLPKNWVQGYLDFFAENPNAIGACGLIEYTSLDKKFEQYLNRKSRGLHKFKSGYFIPLEKVLFANASAQRNILEKAHGFGENFKSYGGEELDLMLRIGKKIQFCGGVSVLRENHPDFQTHCKRLEEFGKSVLPLLFKKHPLYFQNQIRWLGFLLPAAILLKFSGKVGDKLYQFLPLATIRFFLRIFVMNGFFSRRRREER
ncbi:MAG: glycosyltransferase family 2 protein, partial [Candidatus Marinimicrobia bacterium]|nr:glycosyltransferase family 2 protein [Candidatus Neomarinimicrobiota bacterium]